MLIEQHFTTPIFIEGDGTVDASDDRCSDCDFADDGHFPPVIPLNKHNRASIDQGAIGDLSPACARSCMGHLGHWDGHNGVKQDKRYTDLRLFKCNMGHWLVVPGLRDISPTQIEGASS